MDKNITIDDLADTEGLSKNYFRKLFFCQYGVNPKMYHIQMKVGHAPEMLTKSTCSIKEIAHKLGYSDQYAFCKQFRAVTGTSPSKLR